MTTPVNPYDFLNGAAAASAQGTKSSQELGQNEFLKLMIAQMRNQDPMKPTDPNQFLSQLAQFSQVTGIQNMQTSISDLATSLRSTQVLNGTSLVGHDVLAPAARETVEAGQSVKGAVDAPEGATQLVVRVKDGSGALVRTFSLNAGSGLTDFTWDGRDNAGTAVPAGQYSFEVDATVTGKPQAVDPLLFSRVSSVTIDPKSGSLTLNTSTGTVPITDVRRVL
jgi:flagellar basal-body rod modification protein FlgD